MYTINEGFLTQSLRASLHNGGYFGGSMLPMMGSTFQATAGGGDMGARCNGMTFLPTGIPNSQRHRHFLGVSGRKFSLLPPSL